MENRKALEFFRAAAANAEDPLSVKLTGANDHTAVDAEFILRFAGPSTRVLDLGSGTGLIVNKIHERVGFVCAVEPFHEFSRFIDRAHNVEVHDATLLTFESEMRFDLITLFGVMHYFNAEEAAEVYRRYLDFLVPGGRLIVKNQFGLIGDVTVDGYSDEQQKDYFANYRHIDAETHLLAQLGYRHIEVTDIYPPEHNRWKNTHFFAISASSPDDGRA